jgi:long-chain acyl-CoA synthetase
VQPRNTLLDLLNDFFRLEGDFLVYDDGYRSWRRSYREAGNAARALAIRFRDAGINPADKVIIWGENRPEWVVALYACLLTGAVAVPVDYRSTFDFVERVSHITDAKVLLYGAEVAAPPHQICWPLSELEWPSRDLIFDPPPVRREDLCQIIFTSGATAEPKGVTITHGNLLANLTPVENEIGKYRRYAVPFQPLRILNLLPLSHLFGQVMAAFIPPMIPSQVVFMRGFSPKEIVRQIRKRRISVAVSVPMILELLRGYVVQEIGGAGQPAPEKAHWLRRWRIYRKLHRAFGWKFWAFIAGAAPLDPELEDFWSKRGYLVIQGYGLTETAPIVSLNHPFHASRGSVGKPIAGVEVQIAPDGEILVRGENVTKGYYGASDGSTAADGWLHTGDIGSLDEQGRLHIRGRKKEMIVTPEGLNVFPEDIERELNRQAGVRDSAIVGEHRPHAVLALDPGADPSAIVRETNARLEPHQQIRDYTVWTEQALPRTEGTAKLKRREIQARLTGAAPGSRPTGGDIEGILGSLANRTVRSDTTLAELGLSSLERVELLTKLEGRGAEIDESTLASAQTVGDLQRLSEKPPAHSGEAIDFPEWSRSWFPRALRRMALPYFLLPLARIFAHVKATGRENLDALRGPALFASNHQSHFDLPVILAALPSRYRYRLATAMSREFFHAWFRPEGQPLGARFRFGLEYFLACLVFHAFPLPQREAGARESLRYMGELAAEGWSVLIFPEGIRTEAGEIHKFQPGVGLIASKTGLPVVPVRLVGLERVLHTRDRFPAPGPVEVHFGQPMSFTGGDYADIARQIEEAVKRLR